MSNLYFGRNDGTMTLEIMEVDEKEIAFSVHPIYVPAGPNVILLMKREIKELVELLQDWLKENEKRQNNERTTAENAEEGT